MDLESNNANIQVASELIFVTSEKDGHPNLCKVWTPTTLSSLRGAVFFIHGGMFSKGNLNSHPEVSKALALKLGLAVITASFRDGSTTHYSSGEFMDDLKSIARYFRAQHENLPFGLVGSSSGGWFALALANALQAGEVDFLIPLCPVSDPHARAVYLQHCMFGSIDSPSYHVRHEPVQAKAIFDHQMQFFESLSKMKEAAKQVHSNQHGIPTLLIVGASDKNVPPQVTQHIQNSWATRTISIGGAGHEIQNIFPTNEDPEKNFVPDIDQFLKAVVLQQPNNSCKSGRQQILLQILGAMLLTVAVLLGFLLGWWVILSSHQLENGDQSNNQEYQLQLRALEQGFHLVYKPFHLVLGFVQMVLRGGARNRTEMGLFLVSSSFGGTTSQLP